MKLRYFWMYLLFIAYSCSSDSDDGTSNPVDTTPPEIGISIPGFPNLNSDVAVIVGNQIQINVSAEDAGGIAKVEGFIDGAKVAEDLSAPYNLIVDLSNLEAKTNGEFNDFTLRVDATDLAGNTVSASQKINIDNEIPSISEVSLVEGAILGGDNNVIAFGIEEDQGLKEIALFVDNQFIGTIDNGVFEFNLETSGLSDGEHIFKITATDFSDNIAIYEVGFIADNTGPEIELTSLVNNQVIDNAITISPSLQDTFSDLFSLSISFRDQALLAVENPNGESYEFNPEQFGTGNGIFKIVARDALLNTTEREIPVSILRRLLQINVPSTFFDSDEEAIVFISTKDGTLLDESPIDQNEQQLFLRTELEPNELGKLMLTFAVNRPNGNRDFARFRTISDIDITVLPQITLQYRQTSTGNPEGSFNANGFDTAGFDRFRNSGARYFGFLNFQNLEEYKLTELGCFSCPEYTPEKYYIYLRETDTAPYEYLWIDASPVDPNMVVDRNTFSTSGVETREINASNLPNGTYTINLEVSGFLSQQEFDGFYFHRMDSRSYNSFTVQANPNMAYSFNQEFEFFRTQISALNYTLNAFGPAIDSFEPLNWTVDWTESNREIQLVKTSQGDILGEIELGQSNVDENYVPYIWNAIINSQENNSFKVPEVPETIKTWDFYNDFLSRPFYVNQVEIKRYEGIPNYDAFLQNVIRTTVPIHLSTPKIESIFRRNPNTLSRSIPIYQWLFD